MQTPRANIEKRIPARGYFYRINRTIRMEADNNYGKREHRDTAAVRDPAGALKKFRQPLFEYLVSGLEAEDKRVRVMAAGMLGALGDPGAAAHLKLLAVDHDPDLREISKKSLMMLYPDFMFSGTPRPDPCEGCMIRLIAEEALTHRKNAVPPARPFPETER
jgi:hypothetical protein